MWTGRSEVFIEQLNTDVKTKTKSLLESLVELSPEKDLSMVIESRGANIIASAITLIESIEEKFGNDLAEDLERKLLSCIRNRNDGKFVRATKTLVIHPKKKN